MFLDKIKSCKTAHCQLFLHFVFVVVYTARIYIFIVYTKEKEELTILTTKHGLLTSYTTRKIGFLSTLMDTKNLLSYKSENLFSDHRSKGHHSYLLSYMEDLFSYHNPWPLAIPEIQFNILSWWHRCLVICCQWPADQNTWCF